MPRHHLLAVWNPLYSDNAMEAHLRVLHDAVRNFRAGRGTEDDVYVWWGKVQSGHRLAPLPHLPQILAIDVELGRDDPGPETHVYLTDFNSLYVAHLGEITTADPRSDHDEKRHIPAYYRKQNLRCDFWFRLWDIRRLVGNSVPLVAAELRKLGNTRHEGRPVSMYGGMIDLPLIVTEAEEKRYFDAQFRSHYTGGRFWVEFDSERAGVSAIEQELREHMFGEEVWQTFGPTTRLFISTAEKMYRDHYTDMAFDFSPVIVEYCKAIEVRTNDLLWRGLGHLPPARRCLNVDNRSVELQRNDPWGLARLARFLGEEKSRCDEVGRCFEHGSWFTMNFPPILSDLARFRGPAAHSTIVSRHEAVHWRNQLCGVGCYGHLLDLAKVQPRRPAVSPTPH